MGALTAPQPLVLVGAAPPAFADRLTAAGFALRPPGVDAEDTVALVVFADPLARSWLAGAAPALAVALLPAGAPAALVDEALQHGAVDTVQADDPALEALLRLTARQGAVWRGRSRREAAALQRAWDELASTRDLLSRLVDTAPIGVLAFDTSDRVLIFNAAAEQMLGVDAGLARQQLRMDDIYVDDREGVSLSERLRSAPQGALLGLRVGLRARSGERVPAALSAAEVYSADGQLRAALHLLVDLRPLLALEARAERAAADLVEGELRSEQLDSALRQLQDLAQPLTALTGIVDLLLDEELPARPRQWLERAVPQLERLAAGLRVVHALPWPRPRSGGRAPVRPGAPGDPRGP